MRVARPIELAGTAIRLPQPTAGPLRALGIRLLSALGIVFLVIAVVYADRDGYHDDSGGELSLLDAAYYTVVTLSTTGYGDITPVSPAARWVNVIFITPARVLFLIILVGTTLEVLTHQFRFYIRLGRWRNRVKNHIVICGYGTKGRNAVNTLLDDGVSKDAIVIVEPSPRAASQAVNAGLTVVEGDATRSEVLTAAQIDRARAVVIAPHADDTAVLITLTARQLTSGRARIIASAREAENAPLLKQSGAHQVVVSAATAGRLLALATSAPPVVGVIEDLLTPGEGMALAIRSVAQHELTRSPRELDEIIIAIVRRGQIIQLGSAEADQLATGDMIIYIRDERGAAAE